MPTGRILECSLREAGSNLKVDLKVEIIYTVPEDAEDARHDALPSVLYNSPTIGLL